MGRSAEMLEIKEGLPNERNGNTVTSIGVRSLQHFMPEQEPHTAMTAVNGHTGSEISRKSRRTETSIFRRAKDTVATVHGAIVAGRELAKGAKKIYQRVKENHPHVQELRGYGGYIDEAENSPLVGDIVLSKQQLQAHGVAVYSYAGSMQMVNENAGKRKLFGLRFEDEKWTHADAAPELFGKALEQAGYSVELHPYAVAGDPTWRTKRHLEDHVQEMIDDPREVVILDFWNFNGARRAVAKLPELAANVYATHLANPGDFKEQFRTFVSEYEEDRLAGLEIEQAVYEQRKQAGKGTVLVEQTQIHFDFQRRFMPLWTVSEDGGGDQLAGFAPNTRGLRRAGESTLGAEVAGQTAAQAAFVANHPNEDERIPITVVPGNRIGRIEGRTRRERKRSRKEAQKRRDGTFHLSPLGQQEYAQKIIEHTFIRDDLTGETENLADILRQQANEQRQPEQMLLKAA